MIEYKIYKIPHGYYGGGWFEEYAPSVTASSYECNNLIIEYEMETEKKQKIELPPELQGKKFRIRKLTPREVLRLMDCEEDDIDKMLNCGLSNSSIYKLAGNSIVQSVLYWIFYKMFINTEDENNGQLTLF